MVFKIYNTLTRKIEVFKPLDGKKVRMYTCGPTVYRRAHIGNIRAYISADVLRRTLEYKGYKLLHVMNITDVGHLTSDADTGEDKMEKSAREERMSAWVISKKYTELFFEDIATLNIQKPHIICKATDHISEQIALIKILEKKGYTYRTSDGIYFDTSKFPRYGDLAKLDISGLQAGARIEVGEKKNKTDFALWKFSKSGEKRDMEWISPWGKGFPGWHIECSAMSMKYLGEHFDIHTGGIDHIPIHHTNEIAQSEAATGKKFVNYWLHGAFLTFKGEKVSKSKGGLYTISELQELGYKPLEYRYMCLLTHYRSSLDFSIENLNAAKNGYEGLKNKIKLIDEKSHGEKGTKLLEDFNEAINDDMNMPLALQVLQKLIKSEEISGKSKLEIIKKMDEVLGLDLLKSEKVSITEQVKKLVEERWEAKKEKNFRLADELRLKVAELGFKILDKSHGYEIEKA